MSENNKFLDDIAKFGNTTLTAMNSMQRQVRKWVSEQVDTLIKSMDLVDKKELEIYKEIAQKAAIKVDDLEKRVAELEKKPKVKSTKPKAE